MLLNGGLPLLLVKGRVKMLRKGSLSNNVEVDCSASTPLDSSIVFRSHLQSVLCFTLASYSYNCCVALLQPGKGFSSRRARCGSAIDAVLVVQPNFSTAT